MSRKEILSGRARTENGRSGNHHTSARMLPTVTRRTLGSSSCATGQSPSWASWGCASAKWSPWTLGTSSASAARARRSWCTGRGRSNRCSLSRGTLALRCAGGCGCGLTFQARPCSFRLPFQAARPPRLHYSSIGLLVAAYAQRAGLSLPAGKKFHHLRHTAGQQMAELGFGIEETQSLLGHTSPTITQVYYQVSNHRLRRVMRRFGC